MFCFITQEVVRVVKLTVLSNLQYCVVQNPLGRDGKPRLGCRELRKGPATFFLHPGMCIIMYLHVPGLHVLTVQTHTHTHTHTIYNVTTDVYMNC